MYSPALESRNLCRAYVLNVEGSAWSGHATREMAVDIFKEALQFGAVALIPYPETNPED